MSYKVFVSHTNQPEDMKVISPILERSATLGIQCYMAEYDVKAGTPLKDKLQSEMQSSDAVLVFVTKRTLDSDWVKWEIGAGDSTRKVGNSSR